MRKDRYIGGGGVFLALKNHLTFVEESSFHGIGNGMGETMSK